MQRRQSQRRRLTMKRRQMQRRRLKMKRRLQQLCPLPAAQLRQWGTGSLLCMKCYYDRFRMPSTSTQRRWRYPKSSGASFAEPLLSNWSVLCKHYKRHRHWQQALGAPLILLAAISRLPIPRLLPEPLVWPLMLLPKPLVWTLMLLLPKPLVWTLMLLLPKPLLKPLMSTTKNSLLPTTTCFMWDVGPWFSASRTQKSSWCCVMGVVS